jgi:hypothetical protein
MPLSIKWSRFNKAEVLANESDKYGVYELGNDSGEILYIGEGQVRTRLICHFPQGSEPVVGTSCYRVQYTGGKTRCLQRQNAEMDSYLRKNGCYPKFNTRKG